MCQEITKLQQELKEAKTNKEKKAIFEKIKEAKKDKTVSKCIAKN